MNRENGKIKIKLDAWEVFTKHVENATYLLNMGQETVELTELAKSEEYRGAVGNFGQEVVKEWLDLIARKGGKAGLRISMFDTIRKNVGFMTLGFKLSTVMVQPTALLDGAALIGQFAFKGAFNFLTDASWRKFIRENFEEIRARIADDPALAELYIEQVGKGVIGKIKRASFWGLKTVDGITASAIAAGAYEKIVIEKGNTVNFAKPDLDAIIEAELIVRRTQASGQFKDIPSALAQGTFTGSVSVDKLLFQFQSFMLNRFSLIQHDMINKGFRIGNNEQGLRIATFLLLAYIAEVGLRRGAEEIISAIAGDEPEDFADVAIPRLGKEIVTSIPVLGSIVSGIIYGDIPIPAISITTKAFERGSFALRGKDKNIKIKNAAIALLIAVGVIGGIPGVLQVDQIIRKTMKSKKKTKGRFK